MKDSRGSDWTWEEHLLAFNLYYQIPFGSIGMRNPRIIELAGLIGRSVGSVSYKLANFARYDPSLQERGIKGMPHGAKGEILIWHEFQKDPENIIFKGEQLLAVLRGESVERLAEIYTDDLNLVTGTEREALVKLRVNQSLFRKRILSAYDFRCCITGLSIRSLLVASHIVPWSKDEANRLNPQNGLCLNSLHDKAFDRGLMWIERDFTVRFSKKLKSEKDEPTLNWLLSFEGRQLTLPPKFCPHSEFLQRHAMACS